MKKFLPAILFLLGVAVFAGVYFFVIRKDSSTELESEEPVAEIPFEKRPMASLTPTKDGHWLKMVIDGIKIDAVSLDYELLYKVADGRTQGVPGSIKLTGMTKIERELLLGSESSGKFRYDEGVEEGTLTLRFRNDKGKLVGKLSTNFHLQSGTTELTSIDGKFIYTLSSIPKSVHFVTMETFGVTTAPNGTVSVGPYGVFASDTSKYPGEINLANAQRWTGTKWEVVSKLSSDVGIFVVASE